MAFPNDVLATKATCSSPVGLPGSIYSREHKKIALLVPETPMGPSASHLSQLWDTAQREGLAWERLCLSEEEQDFLGCSEMLLGTQHSVLKIKPGCFSHATCLFCFTNHPRQSTGGEEASNAKAVLRPAQCLLTLLCG